MEDIDSEKLISVVETRPGIWDMNHSDYGDRLKRKQAWEEIATFFLSATATVEEKKFMGDAVQKRWKHLRDRYSREISRKKSQKFGRGVKRKAPYIYTKQLAFLKDVVEQSIDVSIQRHCPQPQDEHAHNNDNAELTLDRQNERPVPDQPFPAKEKQFAKRKKADPVKTKIMAALEATNAKQNKAEEDDDRHFLLSLLPFTKSIPEHLKLTSRLAMMKVLNRYTAFPSSAPWHFPQHHHIAVNQRLAMYNQPQSNAQFIQPPPQSPNHRNHATSAPESAGSYLSHISTEEESTGSSF